MITKKNLKHLYNPSAKEVTAVAVPAMNFLLIDGEGAPSTSQQYMAAVEALFSLSYALKFLVKKQKGVNYAVLPLRVFSEYVKQSTGAKIALLLIQPKNVEFGEGLSLELQGVAERIAGLLLDLLSKI